MKNVQDVLSWINKNDFNEKLKTMITNKILNFYSTTSKDTNINKIPLKKVELCYNKYILVTGNNDGGSYFWANNYFKNFKLNKNKNDFDNMIITSETVIVLNSFLHSDIDFEFISSIKKKYNCIVCVFIHDFYWFCKKLYRDYNDEIHNRYLKSGSTSPYFEQLYTLVDKIIISVPIMFKNIKNIVPNKILDKCTVDSESWKDDTEYSFKQIGYPKIEDSINIGVYSILGDCKGEEQVNYLCEKVKYYKNKKIQFKIVGKNIPKYKNDYESFSKSVEKNNIHGFLLLNKWGETWCYALNKLLLSQFPVLYNNIGSFVDRIKINKNFIVNNNNENEYYNFENLEKNFYSFLDTILKKDADRDKDRPDLKKFAIYFPQFHEIKENNINFYQGYTDIVNLNMCQNVIFSVNNASYIKDIPDLKTYNLKNMEEYNLLNDDILNKQVDILNKYNFTGIATYYYWFSQNTITNKKLIMFDVIEKLLSKNTNIFFVWANENWSDNPSFTSQKNNKKHIIKNDYSDIDEHCLWLIKCFKHKNYYKIKNKPVFYIHHPWFMGEDIIKKFEEELTIQCVKNGFDGVHIKLNSMDTKNSIIAKNKNKYYDFHPNYKKDLSGKHVGLDNCAVLLDYDKYISNINPIANVQTIFFDFDNYARMIKPDKINKRTKCINNNICNHINYINKLSAFFENTKSDSDDPFILLINALNEWGEKMHIEPSVNHGTYYLDLLHNFI